MKDKNKTSKPTKSLRTVAFKKHGKRHNIANTAYKEAGMAISV